MAKKRSRRNSRTKRSKPDDTGKRARRETGVVKPSFLQRVLRALPLVVLALIFTFVLNRTGLFSDLEKLFLDIQMQADTQAEDRGVVIVDIKQEDLDGFFEGKNKPLDPAKLQALIEKIAAGRPCIIGVDIDTSFAAFKEFRVSPELSNVVWARSARFPDGQIVPLDVLGGQDVRLNERSGLPLPEDDAKNVTRTYFRMVETTAGKLPSFTWAVFDEAKKASEIDGTKCEGIRFPELKGTDEEFIIGYSGGSEGKGRARIPASHILSLSEEEGWKDNTVLRNKIVLLGGSYLDEDVYATPVGEMSGVEILANIVETELRGGGTKPPSTLAVVLLQLFDGVLLISLFQLAPWRKAALLSLPFILVLSFLCSLLTYWSFAHWAFFAPVMLGVVATELFDKGKDFFKKRYKNEITETYQELTGVETEMASEAKAGGRKADD